MEEETSSRKITLPLLQNIGTLCINYDDIVCWQPGLFSEETIIITSNNDQIKINISFDEVKKQLGAA